MHRPEPGDEVPLEGGHPAVEQGVRAEAGRVRRPVALAGHEGGRGTAGVVPARAELGLLVSGRITAGRSGGKS